MKAIEFLVYYRSKMKLKNEIQSSVDFLNNLFSEKLKVVNYSILDKNNFIFYIKDCADQIIYSVLGETGTAFKNFLNNLDLDHPEINETMNGVFSCKKPYYEKIRDVLELKKIIKKENLPFIDQLLNKIALQENDLKHFVKILENFILNKPPVRLLKNEHERILFRKTKKIQKINLDIAYDKGISYIDNLPNDFLNYVRFDPSQITEVSNLKLKVERYKEIGCNFLADDLSKSIDEHLEEHGKPYYGFNKISLTTTSLILAKFIGLELNLGKYHISSSWFGDLWKCHHMYLEYEPKVYPYHLLENCSEFVLNTVNYLESMPDINGKPVFDNYAVVIPSANIDQDLEMELVKKGVLKSILVGEKDGSCYFLCFFN